MSSEAASRPAAPALSPGEALFRLEPRFLWAARTMQDLPPMGAPEVAFAGRSNVGKSSLINALTGRKALARASSEPGRTRELIFFGMAKPGEEDRIRLVDLPGYGYAKAPKSEIARWTSATRDFLRGRATLKRAFVLIDSRHGIKDTDEQVLKALDTAAVVYQIVLTKADKLKAAEREPVRERAAAQLRKRPAAHPQILMVSSHAAQGLDELRDAIAELALAGPQPAPQPASLPGGAPGGPG
jgi:GTP-binding protein